MIVRMRKVSIITKSSWLENTLYKLGEIGVVHIQSERITKNEKIDELKEGTMLIEKAIMSFTELGMLNSELKGKSQRKKSKGKNNGIEYAKNLLSLAKGVEHVKEEIKLLEMEYDDLIKWKSIDIEEIRLLARKGINIRLFQCHQSELRKIKEEIPLYIISRDKSSIIIAVISTRKDLEIPLKEITLPSIGLKELKHKIEDKKESLSEKIKKVSVIAEDIYVLEETYRKMKNSLVFEEARASALKDDEISYIVGYCPSDRISYLQKVASTEGWALLVEDPSDDDTVPTLLKHSKWTKLFKPVMDFIGINPGYREYDTNGIFLIFLSIFFAILISDGGYGALLLITTYIVDRYYKKVAREKILLFYCLSVVTIIWGAVTGSWFGVEKISHMPVFRDMVIPSLYGYGRGNERVVINLCFFIGAIQLSLAHFWIAIRLFPYFRALAQAGWIILIWGIYFIVRVLLLDEESGIVEPVLIASGMGLILIFEGQRGDGILRGVVRGIIRFPLNILTGISSFSDIVSYIRLFAVGFATKEVAVAFNSMAIDIGFDNIFLIIIAVVVLIGGHAINMLLGAMAVLVHGIRLNLLEFSRHLNIQWSGIPYKPFKIEQNLTVHI